jgi:uncharacterized protein
VRVVFDTNVLYSAFAAKGFCEEVLDEAAGDCVTIWSGYGCARIRLSHLSRCWQKLRTTLRVKFKADPGKLPLLLALREQAEIVAPVRLGQRVCRDKDDDIVLPTAVAGKANVIVTGDDDLLALKKFRDIRILSPRQFLEFLDRG